MPIDNHIIHGLYLYHQNKRRGKQKNEKNKNCAYCVEHGDTAPVGAVECPGNCDTCGMCWNLKQLNIDTYFNKH